MSKSQQSHSLSMHELPWMNSCRVSKQVSNSNLWQLAQRSDKCLRNWSRTDSKCATDAKDQTQGYLTIYTAMHLLQNMKGVCVCGGGSLKRSVKHPALVWLKAGAGSEPVGPCRSGAVVPWLANTAIKQRGCEATLWGAAQRSLDVFLPQKHYQGCEAQCPFPSPSTSTSFKPRLSPPHSFFHTLFTVFADCCWLKPLNAFHFSWTSDCERKKTPRPTHTHTPLVSQTGETTFVILL